MTVYPGSVAELVGGGLSVEPVEGANAIGTDVNFGCGCFVRFSLRIDEASGVIQDVTFRSNGCGFMLASAQLLSRLIRGRNLTDLHGLEGRELLEFQERLELPSNPDRHECFATALNAVKATFNDYRSFRLEEYSGEKALICTCFGISEETIEDHLSRRGVTSVDDVSRSIRAGSGCGSCRMLIQEIIDSYDRS